MVRLTRIAWLSVAAALLLSACAAPTGSSAQKPTVRVGSTNFYEQIVVGELYAQTLEANGYRVERKFNLGNREVVAPAIERGEFDMYVEYLATYVTYIAKDTSQASTDPAATHRNLQEALKPKNLTVLNFSTAVDTNAFVITKATADRLRVARLSDLAPLGSQLTLGGPPECPARPFCQQGLERTYNISFKEFKPLDVGGPLTIAALDGNQIDVALMLSSDPIIAQKGYVLLEDDKRLQLADNLAPVVRNDLISRAPNDFRSLLDNVSTKLTMQDLLSLNKEVNIDRKPEKDVAAAWLKEKGIVK